MWASGLDDIRIASPCTESWDEMKGDDQVRFCGGCRQNVYNLSEMTRAEGQALLERSEGRRCVRLFRREDGTVLTKDCGEGQHEKRTQFARVGTRFALLFGLMAGAGGLRAMAPQGAPAMPSVGSSVAPVSAMGEPHVEPPSPPPPPPKEVMMGKMASSRLYEEKGDMDWRPATK